jgi:hypothetical protein
MVDGFNRAVQNFQYKNNIGFGNNTNKMNQIYDTMLFYDLPKLYYETGTLDYSIDTLPAKYRLPGHSKHPATQPYIKRGTGTGMQTFGEIGRGLSDAATALGNLPSDVTRVFETHPMFDERRAKIAEAIETGNLTQLYATMFNEPVSILRMQDTELTERINQNSANFLLLAFDKEFIPFPEDKTKEYGISKEAYTKAQRFKTMRWTPEQFEYQIRAATANSPVKSGAVDVDGIVAKLDPSEFVIENKLKEQMRKDIQAVAPRDQPLPGRSLAESNKQREADLKASLDDPKQLIDLKKQYLSYSLTPGIRGKTKSKDKAKLDYLTQAYWANYNK